MTESGEGAGTRLVREHRWDRDGDRGSGVFPDLPAGTLNRAMAEHVERYLRLARRRREGPVGCGPCSEDLYLVDEERDSFREIIGFRLRGHPLALLGAVRFSRHHQAPVAHGRASLSFFLSRPQVQIGSSDAAPPPGTLEIFLPHLTEAIPETVERLRGDPGGRGVRVDVDLIDFAFDLRFGNPSAIPREGRYPEPPQRRLFRTTHGHVLSGVSVGLYKTLRKGLQFVTLTDAMQHRPGQDTLLPTLAFNRGVLAMEAAVHDGGPDGPDRSDAARTLAFHPDAASPMHILGWAYDRVREPAEAPRG